VVVVTVATPSETVIEDTDFELNPEIKQASKAAISAPIVP
jgi:hypothetical protein